MFRAYLRTFDGQITEKTNTPDPTAAFRAFENLVMRKDLDGQKLAAALTLHNRQKAFHRFDRHEGDADYWRDRLDDLAADLGIAKPCVPDAFSPEAAKALRQHAGWTQAQAAEAAGYSSAQRWSEFERGVERPGDAAWELARIKAGVHPEFVRR